MKQAQAENEKSQRMLDSYKVHYSKKKELIETQNQEVEAHKNLAREFRQKAERLSCDNKALKVHCYKLSLFHCSHFTFKSKICLLFLWYKILAINDL